MVTGIDLNLADPASQRLGVDAELVAHPFEAASTRWGTFNASRRNRTVRSLSSSGYFLALAWSSCLPWNQALHHTQDNPVPDDLDTVPTSDADPLTPIPPRNPGCPARTRHERPASFAPLPLQEYHHYYESVHQHPHTRPAGTSTRTPSPVSRRRSRPGSRRLHAGHRLASITDTSPDSSQGTFNPQF